jgi:hypothetical protein
MRPEIELGKGLIMFAKPRRGVLLLVVLALLAMFAMVAVAFVVLTGQNKRSADRLKTQEAVADNPEKLLNGAANIVFSGPNCDPSVATTSAITWQNLLEKIYGFGRIGTPDGSPVGKQGSAAMLTNMSQASLVNGGQLIEFTLPPTNPDTSTFGNATPIDPFHYVGCVLTMLDGPNAGLSTRIVGINPQTLQVQMLAFEGGVPPSAANGFLNGNHYIVNEFPYSGMGFGFDPAKGALNKSAPNGLPLALLPNAPPSSWGGTKGIIPGGVNSDYTAADYQDPLLALAIPYQGGIRVPIPSLHRADLIAHLQQSQSNVLTNATLLRQVMFRPNSVDHPNFTGSNPNFNPLWDGLPTDINGKPVNFAWDVDNDGDGIPDSIWVDLGIPVRSTLDGRTYKPLFAILCLDLDGRLNLNAHGCLAQTNPAYYQPQNIAAYQSLTNPQNQANRPNLDVGLYSATGGTTQFAAMVGVNLTQAPVVLQRGQGSGPAEVNLLPLFRDSATSKFLPADYQALQALMLGSTGSGWMGRYGPGGNSGMPALPGTISSASAIPGSILAINSAFPYIDAQNSVSGKNFWTMPALDAYGSPPDPQAFGTVALDTAGRPFYISMGGQVPNGPYDIDLTHNAPHAVDQSTIDNPFGVAEFERILRSFDRDTGTLPQRLYALSLVSGTSVLQPRRAEFTTESWGVPCSSGVLPPTLRGIARSQHPVDILYAQLAKSSGNSDPRMAIAQLLPWEIIEGLKMDLNRPFGSGAYSMALGGALNPIYGGTARLIPDQPGTTGEKVMQVTTSSGGTAAVNFNYAADGGNLSRVNGMPVLDSMAARQLYARHLYILMLTLADTDAIRAHWFGGNDENMKRMIAQWAVNVVAYRDHNNIMIPFPYDLDPFTADPNTKQYWKPDNTVKHTVWGCKRPDLLLTEAIAFHDRRTQDLTDEVVNKTKPGADPKRAKPGTTTTTGVDKDPSFNSHYRPQGSLFIELLNPWPTMEWRTPDLAPSSGSAGVDLTKITPPGIGAAGNLPPSPVWRLVIVDSSKFPAPLNGDELADPDDPIVAQRPLIERVVYFVNPQNLTYPTEGKITHYPGANQLNPKLVVVPPGSYAVIGSGDANQQNRTYIGFENGKSAGQFATTRVATLNPTDFTAAERRVVRNSGDTTPVSINVPQVLGIDQAALPSGSIPQRLSISEPIKGYPFYEHQASGNGNNNGAPLTPSPATGQYNGTLDIPVDQQRDIIDKEGVWATLNTDGTISAYRVVYLQRLADPTRPFVAEGKAGLANPQNCNPYRTVDATTVDLTCFNGVTKATDPTSPKNGVFHFESRQRGENNYRPGNNPNEVNLWKQEPANKSKLVPAGWIDKGFTPKAAHYFDKGLGQTLGYLNKPYGVPANGDPRFPFPWLNWSYRPLQNAYEVLLVPTVSSSRLLARNAINPRAYYGYADGSVRTAINGSGVSVYDFGGALPYPHLLNFFESGESSKAGASAQLHRLFAYLGLPSKFANTQIQMRPDLAEGSANYFNTPFNRISRYREPGPINFNTITSPDVLFGAMNVYYPTLAPGATPQNAQINPIFWDKFVRSRRGDGAKLGATDGSKSLDYMLRITGNRPSRFMHPYRTPGGAFLMAPTAGGASTEPPRESDVTLLRSDPDVLNKGNFTVRPLFQFDDYLMNTATSNNTSTATPDRFGADVYPPGGLACMDYNRNPYFRYQGIQKLGSVVSNHSNVFAIWITVGYFEVSPVPKDAGHPDGYTLGQELGSDTGDIVRHRAFYIFDRSIPVGFVRGQDINHEKAILVKRFIE